ncbi:hypothetical protein [Limnoglobus roseus]|uniref:Uncharacterized protein n=1 Tax=Limnoglobus roseus TaxID=2598579 RepID=A0A5C1AH33_9BACT|nr:hypothetical protein [Limnoglobus roseus]QEL18729.1 hypothetical protein PX52LOC_05765 [Limnoglobus roseus]
MRKLTLLAAICAALGATPAKADSLKSDFPICISKELLGQMYEAMLQRDARGADYLFHHGCFMTRDGVQVSLLDRDGPDTHVRVYGGKRPVEAWVSVGALASYQP